MYMPISKIRKRDISEWQRMPYLLLTNSSEGSNNVIL